VLAAKTSAFGRSCIVLEVQSLYLELRARYLHWHLRPIHLWWLEELVRLREERPNVASEGLSKE
jgi:hypothetical protein